MMMFRLKDLNILGSKAELASLPEGKLGTVANIRGLFL